MGHRAAENRSGAERAERGPGHGREPARAGGGAERVEVQLARAQTRMDGLETQAERSDERWEKWLAENQRQQAEIRKEHAAFRKEVVEGFRHLGDKIDRQGERIDKQSDKIDRQGQEMMAISRRADEKLELAKAELERRFSRVDLGLLVMVTAILVTGALSVISILN